MKSFINMVFTVLIIALILICIPSIAAVVWSCIVVILEIAVCLIAAFYVCALFAGLFGILFVNDYGRGQKTWAY